MEKIVGKNRFYIADGEPINKGIGFNFDKEAVKRLEVLVEENKKITEKYKKTMMVGV